MGPNPQALGLTSLRIRVPTFAQAEPLGPRRGGEVIPEAGA